MVVSTIGINHCQVGHPKSPHVLPNARCSADNRHKPAHSLQTNRRKELSRTRPFGWPCLWMALHCAAELDQRPGGLLHPRCGEDTLLRRAPVEEPRDTSRHRLQAIRSLRQEPMKRAASNRHRAIRDARSFHALSSNAGLTENNLAPGYFRKCRRVAGCNSSRR